MCVCMCVCVCALLEFKNDSVFVEQYHVRHTLNDR